MLIYCDYQGTWLDSEGYVAIYLSPEYNAAEIHDPHLRQNRTRDIFHVQYICLGERRLTSQLFSGLMSGKLPIPSNVTRMSQAMKPVSSNGIQQVRCHILPLFGRYAYHHRGGILSSWNWQYWVRKSSRQMPRILALS